MINVSVLVSIRDDGIDLLTLVSQLLRVVFLKKEFRVIAQMQGRSVLLLRILGLSNELLYERAAQHVP